MALNGILKYVTLAVLDYEKHSTLWLVKNLGQNSKNFLCYVVDSMK